MMSGFQYKFMKGNKYITEIGETEKEFIFSLPKSLVAHEPIDSEQKMWIITRLGRNLFLLSPKHPDEETKKLMEELGI